MELKSQEQLKRELTAPLPSEAIKQHPTKIYLSSIKAIYVTERLNNVFGIGGWKLSTQEIERGDKGMVVVKATLTVPLYDIYYESYGGNDNGGDTSKNFDLGDAYKGATTDAITKIGSYLGIAIDVFKGKISAPRSQTPTPTPQPKQVAEPSEAERVANMQNQGRSNPEVPKLLADSIINCKSRAEMVVIYNANVPYHTNDKFMKLINAKSAEFPKPEKKEEAPKA